MLVTRATYPDSRIARLQWRDRAGFSPASRARVPAHHCWWALALLLALAACAPQAPRTSVPPAQRRIVALMPSFVEDLVRVGATKQIVGVSTATDDIPAVRDVPRVADFASVDAERIVTLRPDVVVAIPAQVRLLAPLQQAGIRIVALDDDSYASIFTDLARLGQLSGHEDAARRTIASLRAQTARVRAEVPRNGRRPSVFVVLGVQPIWTAGASSYIGTLLALAGARDAATGVGNYGEYSAEALLHAQPDALVTDPSTQLAAALGREPWRSLAAVRRHRVFVIPNAALLERPGPRYVQGLTWLVEELGQLVEVRDARRVR